MSMVSSYPSSVSRLTQTALAGALFSSVLWMTAAEAGSLSIALPGERAFPESITSARDGTLFVGRLGEGGPRPQGRVTRPAVPDLRRPLEQRTVPIKLDRKSTLRA